ncbi:MAG: SAM-dependent methyltransferase [Candidatus Eiseniibacteriota bacterium]
MRFTTIAHREHRICNPLDPALLERVTAGLGLGPGDRVVDVGCGKAVALVDLARRYRTSGLGVDINTAFLAEGRVLAERHGVAGSVTLVEAEASRLELEPAAFALALCLGSTHALGGYAETLRALARLVRPGGHLLVGQGYWRRAPDEEYLRRLGATADEMTAHEGNVAAGIAEGLDEAGAWISGADDWDRYEDLYAETVERHVAEHPEDPDAPAMLERIRAWRETYHRWGRDTLGFGLYLFRRP